MKKTKTKVDWVDKFFNIFSKAALILIGVGGFFLLITTFAFIEALIRYKPIH